MHRETGLPVLVTAPDGRPQWHDVFQGIPYILRTAPPDGKFTRVISCSGVRPYVVAKHQTRWEFRAYTPKPAEIVISPVEQIFAKPYAGMVMIEPNVKANGHTNKAWEMMRWRELAGDPQFNFVQCGPPGTLPVHPNVILVRTQTFREAMAVLSVCRAFVGTEGGLMHAAAGLKVPGVIIWSEFISPRVTGYSTLTNLRAVPADRWCGRRLNCATCRQSMQAIGVETVKKNLLKVLECSKS